MIKIKNEWAYFDETLNIRYPWYTSGCLNWLADQDLESKLVFEFGVGESTFWYRQRGAITLGVDSDSDWAYRTQCWHCKKINDYITSIDNIVNYVNVGVLFDLVIIDGDYRDECTEIALDNLKSGGYLIIDNYMQPSVETDWIKTPELIKDMEVMTFKEPGHPDWQTIVIKKP